jgi:hypothetical protein
MVPTRVLVLRLGSVGDRRHEGLVAHQWLSGRQKGVLASFVVGTIDQLLFAALRSEGHNSEFEAVLAGLRVPRIGES